MVEVGAADAIALGDMKRRSLISIMSSSCAVWRPARKRLRPKGSGDLAAEDKELFKYLPSGSTAVFGGNYMKLPAVHDVDARQDDGRARWRSTGPGMTEWIKCFTELKASRLAGSANVAGKGLELRMIFTGMKVEDVAKCATRASYTTTIDPDDKFITVELPPPAGKQGYLVAPNGALYMRQSMVISAAPDDHRRRRARISKPISRPRAASNVLGDTKMQALIAKTDRIEDDLVRGLRRGHARRGQARRAVRQLRSRERLLGRRHVSAARRRRSSTSSRAASKR